VSRRAAAPGTELREGDAVFTTSGRPVFLLTGQQPAFRDLGPGINGRTCASSKKRWCDWASTGPGGRRLRQPDRNSCRRMVRTSRLCCVRLSRTSGGDPRPEADRNSTEIDVIGAQESVSLAQAALGQPT
jgi:hypothetical protein